MFHIVSFAALWHVWIIASMWLVDLRDNPCLQWSGELGRRPLNRKSPKLHPSSFNHFESCVIDVKNQNLQESLTHISLFSWISIKFESISKAYSGNVQTFLRVWYSPVECIIWCMHGLIFWVFWFITNEVMSSLVIYSVTVVIYYVMFSVHRHSIYFDKTFL